MDFLDGSKLDFVNDLLGSYFKVSNPNASSTCGCGTSFQFNNDNYCIMECKPLLE